MKTGLQYCIILLLAADITNSASLDRAKVDGESTDKENDKIQSSKRSLESNFVNYTNSNHNEKSEYKPKELTEGDASEVILTKIHNEKDSASSENNSKQYEEYPDPDKKEIHVKHILTLNKTEKIVPKVNNFNTREGTNSDVSSSNNEEVINHINGAVGSENHGVRNIEHKHRNITSVEKITKAAPFHIVDEEQEGDIPVLKVVDPAGATHGLNENDTIKLSEKEEIRSPLTDSASREINNRTQGVSPKHYTTGKSTPTPVRNAIPENSKTHGVENVNEDFNEIENAVNKTESRSTNLQHENKTKASQEIGNKTDTEHPKWLINIIPEGETHTGGDNENEAKSKPATEEHQNLTEPQELTNTKESTKTEGPAETPEPTETQELTETRESIETQRPAENQDPIETQEPTETKELAEAQTSKIPYSAHALITIPPKAFVPKSIVDEHMEPTVLAPELLTKTGTHKKQTNKPSTISVLVSSTTQTEAKTTSTTPTEKLQDMSYLTGHSTSRIPNDLILARTFESIPTRTLHGVDAVITTQSHPIICSGEYTRGAVITAIIGGVILGGGLVFVCFIFKSRCRRYVKGDYRPVPMEYDFELNPRYKTR